MKSLSPAGLAAAGLCLVSAATAAPGPYKSDPIVVTATRAEQPLGESLAAVSVITRDDIELSGAEDLYQLLRLEAGVDVARTGGPGQQTGVFLRGTNSNHVLVLIDGMRVASAGTGAFAFETLDPAVIERVEIVRGPQAARWGSDALGGVIQIFTRKPDGASVRVGAGSHDTRSLQAAYGTAGDTRFGISAGWRDTDGFSAQNPDGFAYDPDDDGHENKSLGLNGGINLETGRIDWNLRGADGKAEYDEGLIDFRNYAGRGVWSHAPGGDWSHELSAGFALDENENAGSFSTSLYETTRYQAGWLNRVRISESLTWLGGIDAWNETFTDGTIDENRWNAGAWTGLNGRSGAFDYQASARYDHDELYGSAVTGQLAGGWNAGEAVRLHASLGRGFRAPTFNQLFSPGFGGQFAGNPDLDPETSWSAEAGLNVRPGDGHVFRVAAWETRIDDLIAFSGPDFMAVNIEEAEISGIETAWDWNGETLRTGLTGTWQNAENADTGADLLRRAEWKGSATLDWLFGNGSWLGVEVVHTGERPDVGGVELDAYTLVNLRAGFELPANLRLEGRVENLADQDYEPVDGYNASGRAAFIALSWGR